MAQLPIAIKATAEQERLERQATEDLTAALQKWAAALLRNVNSFNLNTMLDRLNNPRWAGNIAMRDALIAIMQRAAEVGVDAGIEALYSGNATKAQPVIDAGGVDWELVNVDAAEWALNYSHLLMNDISSTTRRAIQREIAYYVENSMTINQLRDRIMSLSTFSETRANRIAVTETTRAYAEGNMRAWSDLDYVERVRWQTANDDLVCPICGPLNQQTVAKGELFAGRYYSPPAHVNCRCGVSPVVTGAEDVGAGVAPGAEGVRPPHAVTDTASAERYIREMYGLDVDLSGLDDERAREVAQGVHEHYNNSPGVPSGAKAIKTDTMEGRFAERPLGVVAEYDYYSKTVYINSDMVNYLAKPTTSTQAEDAARNLERALRKVDRIKGYIDVELQLNDGNESEYIKEMREKLSAAEEELKSAKKGVQTRWSVHGDQRGVKGTVVHELGHGVHFDLIDAGWDNYGVAPSQMREQLGLSWDEWYAADIGSSYGENKWIKLARTDGLKVSQYATTNDREFFAESWAAYKQGERANIYPELLNLFDSFGGGT